ncbi:hypothetical protein ANMWB30_24750 [Arthrobacter sp. MWB30]|nr:hypothetical protein ANMWB30_24750 [Arthrobacter sp. MWB30]
MSEQRVQPVEHELRMQESNIKFFTDKLNSELRWLESGIADLRREVERGAIFEQRNVVAKAADVAEVAGKLRAAIEAREIIQRIIGDQQPERKAAS